MERSEGLVGRLAQVNDRVRGDKKGGVGPLVGVSRGVVHDLLLSQRVRLQLPV